MKSTPVMMRRFVTAAACLAAVGLATRPARTPAARATTGPAAAATGPATTQAARPAALPWADSMAAGYVEAQRLGRPILVDVGAAWCGPCRALHEEINKPGVQAALASWTLVALDADKPNDVPRTFAITAIPALRILSPIGKVVASHDGFLDAAELVQWLTKNREAAAAAGGQELLGEVTASNIGTFVARLGEPDAGIRELCLRRLADRPELAAPPVADAMTKGNLAVRLSAVELLRLWKAPLGELDPWQPQTITPERLKAVKDWAATAQPVTVKQAQLSPERLAEAKRDLAAVLAAGSAPEVTAARERLAAFGPALLPEVAGILKEASTDEARERLTAVRYRLAAADALVVTWPGGLERLSSSDAVVRRPAATELAARASAADVPLLLELFTDPDPLIRETSLAALQKVGNGATDGLTRLLHDPEPNVRAAVLKELADAPSPQMLPAVVAYVKSEKDLDLVVHAVRALRAAKSPAAAQCLVGLLAHESWRVRAETVDALSESAGNGTDEAKAVAFGGMVKLLEDPDGFVVARAVAGLQNVRMAAAVEPLAKVAERYPELAAEAVKGIERARENNDSILGKLVGVSQLQRLFKNTDPRVRTAALMGLVEAINEGAADNVLAGLKDPASSVRVAAGEGMLALLTKLRPSGTVNGERPERVQWLTDFRATKGSRTWMATAPPDLKKMIGSSEAAERLAAAAPLAALGDDERAMPVLLAAAADPAGQIAAAHALPWLPWERRLELFNALTAHPTEKADYYITEEMAVIPDPRAAPVLWELLGRPAATGSMAEHLRSALAEVYFGSRYYDSNSASRLSKATRDAMAEKAMNGTDLQRSVALALLLSSAPDAAAELAPKVRTDPKSSEWGKLDAFQILLLSLPKAQGTKAAVEALAHPDGFTHKVVLPYLATEGEQLSRLRGEIYLYYQNNELRRSSYSSSSEPVVLSPPKDLTLAMVEPYLNGPDAALAADAAYLGALLGDRPAADRLIAHWRTKPDDREGTKVVVRAIAALNDDALTPVLEEIYEHHVAKDRWEARQFYWTIRTMTGPNVLKLRKKVRDEVGMDQLR